MRNISGASQIASACALNVNKHIVDILLIEITSREREREIKIGISIQDVTQIKKTKDYCLVKFHDEIDF